MSKGTDGEVEGKSLLEFCDSDGDSMSKGADGEAEGKSLLVLCCDTHRQAG